MKTATSPKIGRMTSGRALYIGREGEIYVSRRYSIYRSDDAGASWRLDCIVPRSGWKPFVAWTRLTSRLLRYYIAAFEVLPDGARIAVARDGIYRVAPGDTVMKRTFRLTRGSRPINLAVDGNRVIFGEYGSLEDCEVCIYVSEDGGETFEVGYQFSRGEIRHVHNVLVDPHHDRYLVFTGDWERQAGIGVFTKDFKTLDWINRGDQRYRAVNAIIMPDRLVYGMDSNRERNFIVAMELQNGRVENLQEVQGSSLYAASFGPIHAISTCVEPNPASPSRDSSLYVSEDCENWKRLLIHRKDCFDIIYFQFGTIVLPYSYAKTAFGMYSGQALQEADNAVFMMDWNND